ncbi:MAG: OmpA family protein [Desulfuromonadaceae bacterium]|nr:OmpA family protein [Desulfuromonadaceae bacterium]MDD2848609.1 OmpA family protein [Desulfuromonadaceae bacterium]
MIKRLLVYMVGTLFMLSASGCLVAESKYLKKVGEADGLSQELATLQQAHKKLTLENNELNVRFNKLTGDAAALAVDKKQLEEILRAKSDTLSKNISEARQQVAELKIENSKLNADISEIQRVKEEKVKEVSGTYEQLLANMKNEIAKGQVTISELKGKLTVNMEAAILFDSGSAEVKTEGLDILNKMVETLKNVGDKAIRIEGHTDVVQISGSLARTFPTNWELSAARAINVTRFLQQQGIDPRNLSAAAFAEYKPVADNATKEGRAKNRRIEITLVAKD